MLVIPAIDIIGGTCVRLAQGNFAKRTIYNSDPVAVAKDFEQQGAQFLHVVDLDGARSGFSVNAATVLAIAKAVSIPIQVGGGIRSYNQARAYFESGVEKIILSTVAIEDPQLLERLIADFGSSRVEVSVDIKDGNIATRGWLGRSTQTVSDFIAVLKKIGITSVIVTDTSRDGLLKGPNFDLAKQFIYAGFITIAAGGISSLSDIREFNKVGAFGVIVGKAVYEGMVCLREAQQSVTYKNDLTKRVIPCLDVDGGRVVKGRCFSDLRDVGDPVELGERYGELGADELVFLDISATRENRKTFRELVAKIAKEVDVPFTVGGGISTIEDIRRLLNAGADKVSIGSAAVKNPDFIGEAAQYFGSQCIVVSVDAKRVDGGASDGTSGCWKLYIRGGTEETNIDAVEFSQQMERLGAGELLVNSLDRDGMGGGFDLDLLRSISGCVNIPVIASSGAGSAQDFLTVFRDTDVDAALGASVFHYHEMDIMELKKFLFRNNISIRI